MPIGFYQSQVRGQERESKVSKAEGRVFLQTNLSSDKPSLLQYFYELETSYWVQPILIRKRLPRGINNWEEITIGSYLPYQILQTNKLCMWSMSIIQSRSLCTSAHCILESQLPRKIQCSQALDRTTFYSPREETEHDR